MNDMEIAIEAKATGRILGDHLNGLRQLAVDHPRVRRRIARFVKLLSGGEIL